MTDLDLRSRFDALRQADRADAPEFEAMLGRPVIRRRGPALLVTIAAAAVVLVAVGVRLVMQRARAERANVPSILLWQSPTASLLRTPGLDLIRRAPMLESSVLRNPGA